MTSSPQALMLVGAVGAMAFGAIMVFVARWRDFVALWLGLFLGCVATALYFGAHAAGPWAGILALPFLAFFVAALRPGLWARRAALVAGLLGAAAAAVTALAAAQALALAIAAWAAVVAVQLGRERRTFWPGLIALIALAYPGLTLGLVPA